uniref:Uncharacterized protein n=1 Tax=Picea glauca TaxID=3330 RepID=A0A117NIW8_PICGL|nr:hypothetical protein ABT39_MTgene504 [Picea glauca]
MTGKLIREKLLPSLVVDVGGSRTQFYESPGQLSLFIYRSGLRTRRGAIRALTVTYR